MKRTIYLIAGIILCLSLCTTSCQKEKINSDKPVETPDSGLQGDGIIRNAVTDYDGNTYDAVRLGDQVWMASNLRTTHYASGYAIDEGSGTSYHTAYYYKPDGDPKTYGYYYNWPAVMNGVDPSDSNPSGVQGVCPDGWHVPSDAEWDQLTDYCKGNDNYACIEYNISRYAAKSLAAVDGWEYYDLEYTVGNDPSTNNATGFGAVPAGYYPGISVTQGKRASFWGASGCDYCTYAYEHYISYNSRDMYRLGPEKYFGMSVRCVKD